MAKTTAPAPDPETPVEQLTQDNAAAAVPTPSDTPVEGVIEDKPSPAKPAAPAPQKASICRMVQYQPATREAVEGEPKPEKPEPIAAVIVGVSEGEVVNLRLFEDSDGTDFNRVTGVAYDEKKKPGTWHWPARV